MHSLKRTVRLHHIAAKSPEMIEKELLIGLRLQSGTRRDVSGSSEKQDRSASTKLCGGPNVVDCAWHQLVAATTPATMQRDLTGVLKLAAQCTFPKRKQERSYPRLLWRRQPGFPYSKGEN